MSTVLITRPLAESQKIAQILAAKGHRCLIEPMLNIQPVRSARSEIQALSAKSFQAIILTSQHALQGIQVPAELLALPVYAVGMKTARSARKAGFSTIHTGTQGISGLTELIGRNTTARLGSLLYLRAQQISQPVQPLLSQYHIQEIITYRALPSTQLSEATQKMLNAGQVNAILFFSRQSAMAFQAAAQGTSLNHVMALCISPAVALALDPASWGPVHSALQPSQAALLTLFDHLPKGSADE